jgi:hypothetical protein
VTDRQAWEALHNAIGEHAAPEDELMLTRWALVAEWTAADGTRVLTRLGSAGSARWDTSGLFHEALYGEWPPPE